MNENLKRPCPVCGRTELSGENARPPFCSERCAIIDLGAWASEAYRVPCKEDDDDDPTLVELESSEESE